MNFRRTLRRCWDPSPCSRNTRQGKALLTGTVLYCTEPNTGTPLICYVFLNCLVCACFCFENSLLCRLDKFITTKVFINLTYFPCSIYYLRWKFSHSWPYLFHLTFTLSLFWCTYIEFVLLMVSEVCDIMLLYWLPYR